MEMSAYNQWCLDALGVDPAKFAGQAAGGTAPASQQPNTLSAFQQAPAAQPAPTSQPPAPQSKPPDPPIDPSPITLVVSAERLGGLLKSLDQTETQIQDAMAADDAMRVALKRRKIDVRDKDALAKRLADILPAIDPEAMKQLRTAKGLVDEAADGLQETLIEIEGGRARLQNLAKLIRISRKDDAKADDQAGKIVDGYDFVVSSEKAVMDILPSLLNPFSWASGVLELLGSDKLKDGLKDHYKDLLTKNQELSKHLDEVVKALHAFGRDETRAEGETLAKLAKLKDTRLQHCLTALTNFVADLGSLPAKGGGKTPPAFKEIIDSYRQVDAQSKHMAAVKKTIEKQPTLRDEELLKALQPVGTFDPKLTNALAKTQAGGQSVVVYVQDSAHVTVFNLPSGLAQADLNGLAARVNKLKLFDAAVHDAASVAESWKTTIDSQLSM